MLKNYVLIIFGLLIVLAVNSYHNLNSSHYQKVILDSMTYQVFKDLDSVKEKSIDEKNKLENSLKEYIEIILHKDLYERNDIVKQMIFLNIIAIAIILIIGGLHYILYIVKNSNKTTIIRLSIVFSVIWVLIIFTKFNFIEKFYKVDQFIIIGTIPPILLLGLLWVRTSKLK